MIPGVPAFAQSTFDLAHPTVLEQLAAGMMSAITTPARQWFTLRLRRRRAAR